MIGRTSQLQLNTSKMHKYENTYRNSPAVWKDASFNRSDFSGACSHVRTFNKHFPTSALQTSLLAALFTWLPICLVVMTVSWPRYWAPSGSGFILLGYLDL